MDRTANTVQLSSSDRNTPEHCTTLQTPSLAGGSYCQPSPRDCSEIEPALRGGVSNLVQRMAVDYRLYSARAISVISVAPIASAWRMASRMSIAVTTCTATKATRYLKPPRLDDDDGAGFGRGTPEAGLPEEVPARPTLDPVRAPEAAGVSGRREARVARSFLRPPADCPAAGGRAVRLLAALPDTGCCGAGGADRVAAALLPRGGTPRCCSSR